MKIFVLSPHIDDAAFGLALTISKCANNNIHVTIINCFTVTKWTAIQVENKEIEAVSQLRKNEDAAFYKAIGNINILNLDLLDAPLRNGYIFQNQPFQANELELIEELKQLLEKHVDSLLLCPLAIGNHIDHAICREAVIQLYKKLPVIFFEDLPYAQRIGEDQLRRHVHALEEQLDVHLKNSTIGLENCTLNKEQAIGIYKSQLNEEIVSEIITHRDAMKGERIWGEQGLIEEFGRKLERFE
jgi:LmbE family N-acetylglucosaminyl deacetylase